MPDDAIVLLPGDLCHHTTATDARDGYRLLADLPGAAKIITAGNHDWPTGSSSKQLRQTAGPAGLDVVLGTATRIELADGRGLVVAGTCGAWPTMNGGGKHRPCYHKELRRMESALAHAQQIRKDDDTLIVMTHYPPHSMERRPTRMSRMIETAGADLAVYGHVHNRRRWQRQFQGRRGGTEYRFVAADYLNLTPRLVAETGPRGLRVVS